MGDILFCAGLKYVAMCDRNKTLGVFSKVKRNSMKHVPFDNFLC